MIEKGQISKNLFEHAFEKGKRRTVSDVRIGLGYIGIALDDGRLGLAAVMKQDFSASCTALPKAGTLSGQSASNLLKFIVESKNPLEKGLGLATANAIVCPGYSDFEDDAIDVMNLTKNDNVAMVGFFGPLVGKIKATGATLSIIERNPNRPGIIDSERQSEILSDATVAIVTATSILNDTVESILEKLTGARYVTILGPSTPLCPEVFRDTPVHHLGGSVSLDNKKILQVISEGGGTPAMRPFLRFINLFF
ncbi:MAG: DUF364 domain-containing protein [Syntrophales bacterium]|jgi:uncharacterized protein (DUF4213/DUF364 family)|nr:DUF364 domain-containing protein [Syntrophales bacterium]MDY0043681.1 DUF364 domain-containing protein [Syntrophales bacterium]